jgi:hypothetical protein
LDGAAGGEHGGDQPAADAAPDAAEGVATGACGTEDCSSFKADRLLTPAPTKVMITDVACAGFQHVAGVTLQQ